MFRVEVLEVAGVFLILSFSLLVLRPLIDYLGFATGLLVILWLSFEVLAVAGPLLRVDVLAESGPFFKL